MFELIRAFLGYCINCRRPSIVGEFKMAGWNYTFNLCADCVQEAKDKLVRASQDLMTPQIPQTIEQSKSRS